METQTESSPTWTCLDPTVGVYRAEYPVGRGGSATSLAVQGPQGLIVMSPPGGKAGAGLMQALQDVGPVAGLVAPCGFHRMGIPHWQRAHPDAVTVTPERCVERVGQVAARPVQPLHALELPDHVVLSEAAHMKRPDSVMRIRTDAGWIWYINDILLNLAQVSFPLTLLGFRPGLALNRFNMRFVGKVTAPDFYNALADDLDAHPPCLFVAGHGQVERDPAVLAGMADLVRAGL